MLNTLLIIIMLMAVVLMIIVAVAACIAIAFLGKWIFTSGKDKDDLNKEGQNESRSRRKGVI